MVEKSAQYTKVYTVNGPVTTSASSLPTWVTVKQHGKRKQGAKRQKTQHQLGQLELIQDFTFPQSAIKIKTTEDGQYAVGTGTYKPMMKVWDLAQLTVKFERVTDAENVDFVMLSSDWTKSLHLQADRSLQLHTQGGLHHTIRLPTYGRCVAYHSPLCDAIVGATGREVFRFNLEEGRYMQPIPVTTPEAEGVNCVDVNRRHGLWSFGLDGGGVEFWDPRSRSVLTKLALPTRTLRPSGSEETVSVTTLQSHPTDGLSLAVGTSTGHTLLYDIRSPKPFAVKDQGYGEPMKSTEWLQDNKIASADSKVVKVWHKDEPSENHFSLHPPAPLFNIHSIPNTGLILAACDSPQLSAFYVPELGPAPRWASFLDSVTEELEEDMETKAGAYADYKFVDRKELENLGLSHLVGTPALKPYMHGYFLSLKLYTTARLISNPQSYTEYREKLVAEKLAKQSESRIRARKEQPKVNKALAERVRKHEERELARRKKQAEKTGRSLDDVVAAEEEKQEVAGANILQDPRFKELWENPDFEVDEESREFELLNPATANINRRSKTAVEEEAEESDQGSSSAFDSQSESDDSEEEDEDQADSDDSDDAGDLRRPGVLSSGVSSQRTPDQPHTYTASRPRLVAGEVSGGSRNGSGRFSAGNATLGQRLRATHGSRASSSQGGSTSQSRSSDPSIIGMRKLKDGGMEMSFVPSSGPGGGGSKRGTDDITAPDYTPPSSVQRKESSKSLARDRKVERFGAGLEKGGYRGLSGGVKEMSEDERHGRTKRRHPGRSASKNVFRGT